MSLNRLKEYIFQRYLIWKCRPARLRRHLKKILPETRNEPSSSGRQVRAAALQVELKLFKEPLEYADEADRRVREAVAAGARLIVFPEYNSLPLFGMLPGIEEIGAGDLNKNEGSSGSTAESFSLADIFVFMSPAVKPFILTLYSSLAEAYGVYIMAGSYPFYEDDGLVNRSFIFSPAGDLIGSQDKVHLLPVEAEWRLKRGREFTFVDTSLGRLAIPVCMDATYYETFRIMEINNVDIVLLPIANLEEYNYWLALRGIWPRVQESVIFGAKSALVGSIAGFNFTGRAGIYAPLEISPRKDGLLAEVEPYNREAMAVADLDLEALHMLRRDHPWRDRNEDVLGKLRHLY